MRYLFLCLIFTCKLLAIDVTPDIIPLYKSIEITQSVTSIDEAMQFPERFETIKYFRRNLRKKQDNHNLWLKLSLENTTDFTIQREVVMRWDRVTIDLYAADGKKIVFKENVKCEDYACHSSAFTIPAHKSITLYIHVNVIKQIDDFYYLYFVSPEKAQSLIVTIEKLYHNGFFFGILLTMMMYSFFMYFSIKSRSYLYLGFYQASIIFYVSDLRLFFIILFEDMPNFSYYLFKIVSSVLITILSILFTKEFLNTKKEMPRLNLALNLAMVILAIFQLNPSIINYGSIIYFIYIIVGLYAFFKGNTAAIFYTLGFAGFAFYVIFHNLVKFFEWDFYLEYQRDIQIFGCIEAFALSMALYLKIKSIVREKEHSQRSAIEHEKMLLEQSRFATMGEMLASIGHQWRQPLNHLGMINNNLRLAQRTEKLNAKYLDKKLTESDEQLQYMAATIEDFSNFFTTKRKEEKFKLKDICEYASQLVASRLKKEQISLVLNHTDNCIHVNYKNELVQVLTIVLNNAIDALTFNNISDRKITMQIQCDTITIEDNAGGIPETVLPKIFDPYFSTKDKKFGTGLGLYTAKILVKDLINGKITASNTQNGAKFTLTLPSN
jgi:signal transduction histidine kinase